MDASLDRRHFVAASAALAAAGLTGVLGREALAAESAKADAKAASAKDGEVKAASAAKEGSAAKDGSAAADKPRLGNTQVDLHRGYAAAHGTRSFAQAVVAVVGGTIVAASVDEFQFMSTESGVTPLPNSGTAFDKGVADGQALISKTDNNALYSAAFMAKGGTQTWRASMSAIEKFAVGQTPADLAKVAQDGVDGKVGVDTVTGATLEDTFKYLQAIAAVAQDDTVVTTGWFDGDPSTLGLRRASGSARTTHATGNAVVLTQGDKIVAASVDEFEFEAADGGFTPVPNSDADFGKSFPEGKVLVSKSVNDEVYSAAMAKGKTGSKQSWLTSVSSIEETVQGLRAGEATHQIAETLTGSTLVCGSGYAATIALAAAAPAQNVVADGDYATSDGLYTVTVKDGKIVSATINGVVSANEAGLAEGAKLTLAPAAK